MQQTKPTKAEWLQTQITDFTEILAMSDEDLEIFSDEAGELYDENDNKRTVQEIRARIEAQIGRWKAALESEVLSQC